MQPSECTRDAVLEFKRQALGQVKLVRDRQVSILASMNAAGVGGAAQGATSSMKSGVREEIYMLIIGGISMSCCCHSMSSGALGSPGLL